MRQCLGKSYTFAAAHRILGHEGKCANLHGHTYTAEVSFRLRSADDAGYGDPATVDNLGRIVDYSVIDDVIGGWIKEHWDHGALLHHKDPVAELLFEENSKVRIFDMQPTAEVLASALYVVSSHLAGKDPRFDRLILNKVIIRESPTSFAEVG